jgi:hypothetical protein
MYIENQGKIREFDFGFPVRKPSTSLSIGRRDIKDIA